MMLWCIFGLSEFSNSEDKNIFVMIIYIWILLFIFIGFSCSIQGQIDQVNFRQEIKKISKEVF